MKIKLLFIALISTFSLFSQIPSYIPTTGLVGWYPFNGNANDESGSNNNGTANNTTLSLDRFGNSNTAFLFNGSNSYISMPSGNLTTLNLIGNYTVSFWIKTTDNSGLLVSFGDNVSGAGGYLSGINAFNSGFGLLAVQNSNNGLLNWISYVNTINDGNWHNVLYTYESNTLRLYVDNFLEKTITSYDNQLSWNGNRVIGCRNDLVHTSATNYDGVFDDLAIFNRALTPQEITNLYLGCNINPVIPIVTNANIGQNAQITSNVTNCQYVWESNSNNLGWTIVPSNISYSNVTTNNLSINNIQVSNHLQEFRVIATQGNCVDTSNVSTIIVNDTCINTVNDTITTHITVTDTLLINVAFAGLTPPNNSNTIKVYPNPANDFVIIDNGNFAMMSGYSVKITNSLGATVFNSPINQAVFNVSTTTFGARGVYYIHILNSNNAIIDTREIVLQ